MIIFYRLLGFILFPLIVLWIAIRLFKGKEEISHIGERFGFTSQKRSAKKYIWIHAASVGESLIALNLAHSLKNKYVGYDILITTGTVTSAKLVSSRLKDGMIHQYIPIDEYFSVRRFIKFWTPSIGIFIESEIWPNLVSISSDFCPILIASAIMSEVSLKNWKKYPDFARHLFSKFSAILCQTSNDVEKYRQICDINVVKLGNLKFSSPIPFVNKNDLVLLREQIRGKVVLLAASTHDGDEKIILDIFSKLHQKHSDLILIIAVRHPYRSDEVSKLVSSFGFGYALRSSDSNISKDVYIVDTIGELGLFYSIADISFIGGSFNHGGHNFLEATFFDAKIVVGPDMSNFLSLTEEFVSGDGILQAKDEEDLLQKIDYCLTSNDSKQMIQKARDIVSRNSTIIDGYVENIGAYLK
ncbi:MAG: 3-deoxy-D-manno-octulosonic acid transferase [Rickettsiaceae bacterium]|nr:3-deoxy-D-manno-octulosonic acid transferase [Rickettsiaceae bacterium]